MQILPSADKIKYFWQSCFKTDSAQLDPISILALTALMPFKEEDTKIHITNAYQVVAQQPSEYHYGINLRGAFRFCQGASHEDLAIIRPSIEKAARWYQPQVKENKEIRKLFLHAKAGLDALRNTYMDKSGITSCALENWKKLIDEAYEKGLGPEEALDLTTKKVKNLWDTTDISKINVLLDQMFNKQSNTPIKISLKCHREIIQLENLLEQKADGLRDIFQK